MPSSRRSRSRAAIGTAARPASCFAATSSRAFYGRDNPTDTLTTIVATACSQAHNYASVSKTLAAGSTPMDHLNVAVEAMQPYGVKLGFIGPSVDLSTPKYPRAVTLYGMARNILFDIARNKKAQISYKLNQIQIVGQTDSLPGGPVVLNSTTGMVGMPTQEIGGIMVRSLINPAIKVNGLIKINQADIQRQLLPTTTQGDRRSCIQRQVWIRPDCDRWRLQGVSNRCRGRYARDALVHGHRRTEERAASVELRESR